MAVDQPAYAGKCMCGTVQVEFKGAPFVHSICHCDDCKAYQSCLAIPEVLWPYPHEGYNPDDESTFRIIKGQDNLTKYSLTPNTNRHFCKTCGSPMFNLIPSAKLISSYPSILRSLDYQPTLHIHCKDQVWKIKDGLPKYYDLPAEYGGSGKMVEE